jgi:hypothetical protein
MDAALVDRMVEDVNTLAKINMLVGAANGLGSVLEPRLGYKVVPFLAVGQPDRGTLGLLAAGVFEPRSDGVASLRRITRDLDIQVLGRLPGGDGSRRGDLLSHLYFHPDFIEASIELGRRDAREILAGDPREGIRWQLGPRAAGTGRVVPARRSLSERMNRGSAGPESRHRGRVAGSRRTGPASSGRTDRRQAGSADATEPWEATPFPSPPRHAAAHHPPRRAGIPESPDMPGRFTMAAYSERRTLRYPVCNAERVAAASGVLCRRNRFRTGAGPAGVRAFSAWPGCPVD